MPLGPMKTKKQKRAGMKTEMDKFKSGKLHSGSAKGPKVKSRKQAVAIALNETGQGRKKGSPAAPKKSGRNAAKDMSTDDFEKKYGNSKL